MDRKLKFIQVIQLEEVHHRILHPPVCADLKTSNLCFHPRGGGGSSIVKVPGDVPPARVCFFKPSSLAKGIIFANFSPFSLAKGILFANFPPFSLGKGILFGNFGQRNVKLR